MTKIKESAKNQNAMIGGAITALLVAGGFTALVFAQQGTSNTRNSVMLAQAGDPGLGDAEDPSLGAGAPVGGAGGFPGGAPGALPGGAGAGTKNVDINRTSFRGVPPNYGAGGGTAPGGFGGLPAGYGPPGGFGGGAPAATTPGGGSTPATEPDFNPFKPYIARGKTAPGYRADPFKSYRIPEYQKPSAYNFLAPIRMAKRPEPPKPEPNPDPELQYGPLPFVPRRVAGILFNGEVSAILEIGNPGAGAVVFIVSPGSRVPSGIPGIPELTVASISPTQLVLRAEDGRKATVALSGAPGLAGSMGGGIGAPGAGMPGGGFPGGGRGGFPGGRGGGGGAAGAEL